MAVRSATGGKADFSNTAIGGPFVNIPEVRRWNLTINPEIKTYASSTTAGAKQRLLGSDDFNGSILVYVDSGTRIDEMGIKGGFSGWLKLYEDSGQFFLAPVFIDSVDYEVDIEGGELIPGTINYSRNGALTYPT